MTEWSINSLFRFKLSVSNTRLPFYTGRRVRNQAAYDLLCEMWLQQHTPGPRPNYFLLYRLEGHA